MNEHRKIQVEASIKIAEDQKCNPLGVSAGELQTAIDLGVPLIDVVKIIKAYHRAIEDVVAVKMENSRVRREALRNLTQESQDIEGGYR